MNVFFFSGIFRFKAILLLPIWIGWECLQNLWLSVDSVAYTAHIGGLFIGAVMGIFLTRLLPQLNLKKSHNPIHLQFNQQYSQALYFLTNLDFPEAKKRLFALHEQYPDERAVLYKLYVILKLDPHSSQYKEIAQKILKLKLYDPDELAIQSEVNTHYHYYYAKS